MDFLQFEDGHHTITGGSNTSDHEAGNKNGDSKVRILGCFIFRAMECVTSVDNVLSRGFLFRWKKIT